MKNIKQICITLILLCSNIATAYELPDLGERSETYISSKKEKQLGKEFMKAVRLSMPILDDPIIEYYIQNLGEKLASHSHSKKQFHFFVVNDSSVNAFAGPAGYIGTNSGTIEAADSESELAAVMAHEIAHVSQHHIERLIRQTKNVQLTALAGALAAIIIGSTGESMGNIAMGGIMTAAGGAAQNMINFTREHEIEADNIGMRILHSSSFDPHAMPTFFEKIQRLRYTGKNGIPKFLQNHPVNTDRIAESKNRADNYPTKKTRSANIFYLVKARLEIITSKNISKTIKKFKTELNSKQQDNKIGSQYGYALALYSVGQLNQSAKIVAELQQKYPKETIIQMLAAELALKKKQTDKSLDILRSTLARDENYIPLIIQYGGTLIKVKRSQTACDFIREKSRKHPNNLDLQLILAKAYGENGQKSYAYQARAKAYEIDGYYRQAVILLRQALKAPKLSTNNRAIISAKIERLKKLEKN